MICEYAEIDNSDEYKRIQCKLKCGNCIYSTFCTVTQQYIHTDNYQECYIMNEQNKKRIPNGANYVRFIKNGFLYVEYNDSVVKIKNPFNEADVTNYVYVKEDASHNLKLSLQPFKRTKQRKND